SPRAAATASCATAKRRTWVSSANMSGPRRMQTCDALFQLRKKPSFTPVVLRSLFISCKHPYKKISDFSSTTSVVKTSPPQSR
ncbi:unnamed protein product, partial [Amoebophrya sp. A120]